MQERTKRSALASLLNRPGWRGLATRFGCRFAALCATALLAMTAGSGCALFSLAGGMSQNFEYQKKIQVFPKYTGLENQRVAVVVNADLSTQYEHPNLVATICGGVSQRIQSRVHNVRVLSPDVILRWQYQTPQWNALPYGDIAEAFNVDRVVVVDVYEYRLNPPGNAWEWEGVCAANVGIVERDGLVPDFFADEFEVFTSFPPVKGLPRDQAERSTIEQGLLLKFVQHAVWLFHEHEEPKYPDKYRPELDT